MILKTRIFLAADLFRFGEKEDCLSHGFLRDTQSRRFCGPLAVASGQADQ